MEAYSYRAVDESGERTRGTLTATSRQEALERLLGRGVHVLELEEAHATAEPPAVRRVFRRRAFKLSEVTRQLATLTTSGVPLVESMSVLIEQSENEEGRELLADILDSVKTGKSLSDAMAEHRELFPDMMISMVHMGEVSGTLDSVLTRLAELFEKQEEIRGEVKAALAYPALVLLLGIASAIFLVSFVIPRLGVLFEGLGEQLPLPTRMLLGISGAIQHTWWMLLLLVLACVVAFRMAFRRPEVQYAWDRFKLALPWAGNLIRQAAIARFARALGTLVHADVPMVEALDISRTAVGSAPISRALEEIRQKVQGGDSLAALMKSSGVFPPLPVQMVAVGEETGHLDEMLIRVAEAYDRQTAASTRMMTSMLAPALILCVAVVVAFIIISLVLPIFRISAGIG